MAGFFKKIREKKTDPLRDVHMAFMSLPTISIIFGFTAMIGDPMLSSLGSVASAIIALSGVIVGSRGVNNLVANSGQYPNVEKVAGGIMDSEGTFAHGGKVKAGKMVGDANSKDISSPLTSMSGNTNAKHLSREEKRMLQEEKDLAEAKKIIEDSKEQNDKDFSNLFSNTIKADDYSQEDLEESVMSDKIDLREQSTEK